MRFLLDANLPRSAATVLRSHGHDVEDVRDIGMRFAADSAIAKYAQTNQRVMVSADFDFADVRIYPSSRLCRNRHHRPA
jgi:predicted nuclease of predicted toxin-antitoxin system